MISPTTSSTGELPSSTGPVPDSPFQEICEQLLSCNCEDFSMVEPFPDEATCAAHHQEGLEAVKKDALEAGLIFDENCYVSHHSYVFDFLCLGNSAVGALPFPDPLGSCGECQVGFGSKDVGEVCTALYWSVSDCKQGLFCMNRPEEEGHCFDNCPLQQAGDPCVEFWQCAPGLICLDQGICAPFGQLGEPCVCNNPPCVGGCGGGLWCNDQQMCVPPPGEGEVCSYWCEGEDLRCHKGICVLPGPEGDPCESSSDCWDPFFHCSKEGFCVPQAEEGGSCVDDHWHGCQTNLAICVSGICVSRPGDGELCINGNICAQGLDCIEGICSPEPPNLCEEP